MPMLMAKPAGAAAGGGGNGNGGDKCLPDPSVKARNWFAVLVVVAIIVGILMNVLGLTNVAFTPPKGDFNFALFAGFYAGAQIIERAMEFVVPLLPAWPPKDAQGHLPEGDVLATYVKADRAKLALGIANLLGVIASAAFGLFFLHVLGVRVSHTIDTIVTGLLIGAGTKPLHDFIDLLQDQNNPKTGTTVA
jgi:hypothetical protein